MAQLPMPGGDNGTWGTILNGFLEVAHNGDGSLQQSAITAAGGYVKPAAGIPTTDLNNGAQASLAAVPLVKVAGDATQSIIVPAYFYPTYFDASGGWQTMQASAPNVSMVVINPNSGPGSSSSSDYVTQVAEAQAAGIRVLGYVTTDYTNDSEATVKAQVDDYYNWYAVDGIFFDQVSGTTGDQSYYADIYNYAKAKPGQDIVVINPGAIPDESYMAACDICCYFEGTLSDYMSFSPASWQIKYAADRFLNIVYNVMNSSELAQALQYSRLLRAGYIYVTDDSTYVTLAGTNTGGTYFATELSWVRSGGLATPTPAAPSAVTVASTASIAQLGSLNVSALANVPGGTPAAGARFAIKAFGTLSTASSAPTFVLDLRWGGTNGTLITSLQSAATANAPALIGSLANAPVLIEGEVTFQSSTTCVAWLRMTWQNAVSATTPPIVALSAITSSVTVTTGSAQALSLDWTWSASSASNTLTIASSSFERAS